MEASCPATTSSIANCSMTRGITQTSDNVADSCAVMETSFFNAGSQLMETCALTSKNCQLKLGPVDVEDLATYFDLSADIGKSPSTSSRAIYSRRSRYGQSTRVYQPRQVHHDCPYVGLEYEEESGSYYPRSCFLEPDGLRPCDSATFGDLRISEDVALQPSALAISDLRFGDSPINNPQPCGFGLDARETGRSDDQRQNNSGQNHSGPNDWFCQDCPEMLGLCSEERWLHCSVSDRCPLYNTSSLYGAPVLPPCMYENLGYNQDGWYRDFEESEQFLEDYLSNEKRKERSRDAARCRRSRETDIFTELAAVLPVAPEQAAHLDKASVMRLAIAYLKVRAVVDSIPASVTKSESLVEMDELFPKALNGFMLVLSGDGNMVYLSENVSDYLGVSQMDMMGQSVYEYSHPCDHEELRECLTSKPSEDNEKCSCNFFLRLKCTITNKGRKVNLKSASYKVIHCTGKLANIHDSNSNSIEVDNEEREKRDELIEKDTGACLVLVGSPIPHPSNIEIPLGRQTFLSKHNLSMKFTYADEKLAEYLGWSSDELMGRSFFEFYHALDNLALDKCFKCLFSKGQCETVAYRFLGKRGGYAWVVTQATLIHCSKQQKPISVVCVNYILSGIEHEDEVYSERQLAVRDSVDLVKSEKSLLTLLPTKEPIDLTNVVLSDSEEVSVAEPAVRSEPKSGDCPKPLIVTASVFQRSSSGSDLTDSSRKNNSPLRPAQNEKVFAEGEISRAFKESLVEPIRQWKENDEQVTAEKQSDRPLPTKTPFIVSGKPTIERDPSDSPGRRERPQAVTRHLFAPLTQLQQQEQLSCRPPPQTATASIFAPRTEDMNKGFLTFSEDQPGLTMLKDEPEDLTHLAPTPGDVCVPLEDTPLLSDMLDEFILDDNYCQLLSPGGVLTPELRSATDLGDSLKDADLVGVTKTKDTTADRLADSDPFMYGDSPGSPCGIDPNSVSPSLVKYRQSPERSLDSLGSPTAGSGGDGLSEDEMLMLGITDSIGDDELALRAPYIPMSDQDEALELLISDDMVMWGSSQSSDKASSKWLTDDREQRDGSESSLVHLLRADQAALRRYNDYGGNLVNPAQVFGQIPRKNVTIESTRWSSNQESTERPSKRIHAPSTDSESEHKRLKSSPFERDVVLATQVLEDTSLARQQRSSAMPRKSSGLGSSQLLRRLVSQTPSVASRPYDGASSSSSGVELHRASSSTERTRVLDDIIDLAESDGDRGGGGGGGGYSGGNDNINNRDPDSSNGLDKLDVSRRSPSCSTGSSVLMNLLVSGCDDILIDSRNVPTCLLSKDLMSPLSINVDNQTVPQCTDVASLSVNHLSPDTNKQLTGPFSEGGGGIVSPTTCAIPFNSFDYEGDSATCLLQVTPDLLGSLLDRNVA